VKALTLTVAVSLLMGCGAAASLFRPDAKTPPGEGAEMRFHPHAAKYELLEQASAQKCASVVQLHEWGDARSPDPRAIGPGILFEGAKFDAIHKIAGADGLVGLRARVDFQGDNECVTVEGHAYRITAIEATPGATTEGPVPRRPPTPGDATLQPNSGRGAVLNPFATDVGRHAAVLSAAICACRQLPKEAKGAATCVDRLQRRARVEHVQPVDCTQDGMWMAGLCVDRPGNYADCGPSGELVDEARALMQDTLRAVQGE
jgi:hypothetical protein